MPGYTRLCPVMPGYVWLLTLRSTHVRINHMSEAHRAYGVA